MIRRSLANFITWILRSHNDESKKLATAGREILVDDSEDFGIPIRFNVVPARGGYVVTSRSYDNHKDRTNMTTYIIPDTDDIAERVGQIVSMELLKA
jgi:hypothetical protein